MHLASVNGGFPAVGAEVCTYPLVSYTVANPATDFCSLYVGVKPLNI